MRLLDSLTTVRGRDGSWNVVLGRFDQLDNTFGGSRGAEGAWRSDSVKVSWRTRTDIAEELLALGVLALALCGSLLTRIKSPTSSRLGPIKTLEYPGEPWYNLANVCIGWSNSFACSLDNLELRLLSDLLGQFSGGLIFLPVRLPYFLETLLKNLDRLLPLFL